MSKYDEYAALALFKYDAHTAIGKITNYVNDAIKAGWREVYLSPDENILCIMGVKPPDQEATKAAKEKRRKQYERLKKEFDGDAND